MGSCKHANFLKDWIFDSTCRSRHSSPSREFTGKSATIADHLPNPFHSIPRKNQHRTPLMQWAALLILISLVSDARAGADPEHGEDRPHWDIDSPPGSKRDQPIDVTEGTWISVDVSPDGQQVAFDLLGDLYLMPIQGSEEPRKLTEGMAWDMQASLQPRWALHRLHERSLERENRSRRQQSLDPHHGRPGPPASHSRRKTSPQRPRMIARRPLSRRSETLHQPTLPGRRRDLDVPPRQRGQRRHGGPTAHETSQRPKRRQRAGLLTRRPTSLLFPGRHPG